MHRVQCQCVEFYKKCICVHALLLKELTCKDKKAITGVAMPMKKHATRKSKRRLHELSDSSSESEHAAASQREGQRSSTQPSQEGGIRRKKKA